MTVIPPALRLSPELLMMIFKHVCAHGNSYGYLAPINRGPLNPPWAVFKYLSAPQPAFLVSSVCYTWRTIALATAELWSYIRVHCSIWFRNHAALRLALQRSKNTPLRLEILGTLLEIGPDHVIMCLVSESARWKDVLFNISTISTRTNSPNHQSLAAALSQIPSLPIISTFSTNMPILKLPMFSLSPLLSSLALSNEHGLRSHQSFVWSQIRRLSLKQTMYSSNGALIIAPILSRCTQLEILEVYDIGFHGHSTIFPITTLPRVVELCLSSRSMLYIHMLHVFAAELRFPSLRSLTLAFDGGVASIDKSASDKIVAFVTKSCSPQKITYLCLTGSVTSDSLHPILAVLPEMVEVELNLLRLGFDTKLIRALTPTAGNGGSILLPKMELLSLSISEGVVRERVVNTDFALLFEMVRARTGPNSHVLLKSFNLSVDLEEGKEAAGFREYIRGMSNNLCVNLGVSVNSRPCHLRVYG
ncbi:hypothetical protein VKT23_019429 [Stygiomarasmius scandens]|uniref:F-box domain-containing protein n=1 Tax=Marasmiellus scandens TaxID=2682957 RepID=A0ABR1INN5_9AGAR